MVKNLPANAGDVRDVSSIPRLGRCPGVGNGTPLQYSCLKNSLGRGTWWATVHGVAKSWTWLSTHMRPLAQHLSKESQSFVKYKVESQGLLSVSCTDFWFSDQYTTCKIFPHKLISLLPFSKWIPINQIPGRKQMAHSNEKL